MSPRGQSPLPQGFPDTSRWGQSPPLWPELPESVMARWAWLGRSRGDTRVPLLTVCAENRVCREPCGSGHAMASCQSVYVCLGRELPEAAAHPRAWPPSKARTPCVAGKGRSGCPGAAGGGSSGPGQRQAASSPLPGGTRLGCAPCSPRAREMLGAGPHATCHTVHTRDICAHHTYDTQTPHTPYTQHTLYIALCTHCLHARDIYTHPTHYMCTLYTPRIHHAVHPTPHTQHTHPVMSLVPFPADPRLTPLCSLGGRGTPEQVLVPGPCQVAT